MKIYTVAFFGHRKIKDLCRVEEKLNIIIRRLLYEHTYVDFLIGRNGDFDQIVSSTIRRVKNSVGEANISHILVLPYETAEFRNNIISFENYYDEIEICEESASAHYKSAIQIRNRKMVDRADFIIFFVENGKGGAYETLNYTKKQGKPLLNIAME